MSEMIEDAWSLPRLARGILALAVASLVAVVPTSTNGEEVVENYPSGSVKAKYNLTAGKKNGKYEDFFEDGTPRTRALYKDDLLTGAYLRYHPNGKTHVNAIYKSGKFHGKCTEKSPEGLTIVTGDFVDGIRHGKYNRYVDGKPGADREFRLGDLVAINGVVTHPRTRAEIARELGKIYATRYVHTPKTNPAEKAAPTKAPPADYPSKEHLAAVQRLNAYRNICNIPSDVLLDGEQTYYAQAASVLLKKFGKLDHTPPNPGMPEDEYNDGYKGTSSSNLHQGQSSMAQSVDGYMDDSDESNIDRVGHRRWCINPYMQTTGFGRTDGFSAMWSFDKRRPGKVEWQYVAYPTRGYMPVDYFSSHHAWSVSLNGDLFQKPTEETKAKIFPLDKNFQRGQALELNYENYTGPTGMGAGYCLIFRPKELDITPGKQYVVEISGILNRERKPTTVRYLVEFCEIKPIAPEEKN